MAYQIDMFAQDEMEEMRLELENVKKELKNLRRGIFGRYDQLVNEVRVTKEDIYVLQEYLDLRDENKKVVNFSLVGG